SPDVRPPCPREGRPRPSRWKGRAGAAQGERRMPDHPPPENAPPARPSDPAGSGELLHTGSAPPFRALLGTRVIAGSVAPLASPDSGEGNGGDEAGAALPAAPGYEVVAELGRGGMG